MNLSAARRSEGSGFHHRARSIWRDARPLILLVGGVVVAVLGYWGFRSGAHPQSASDAIYDTAQLFTLQAGFTPPVPWQLEVARIMAPLLVGYAAVQAVLALFREQVELLQIRRLSGHVVIAGLGEMGSTLALRLVDSGFRVATIELDREAKTARRVSARGIPVVRGDATSAEVLDRARIDRASHLVATSGKDAANIDISLAAADVSRTRILTVLAHLQDVGLWSVLRTEALRSGVRDGVRTDFFNLNELAARTLLDRFSPGQRLLVVGSGPLAESLALHAAHRPPAEGIREISIAGSGAKALCARIAAEHPDITGLVKLDALELPSATALAGAELDGFAKASSFVALDDEAEGIKAAFWLSQRGEVSEQIVLVLRGGPSGISHGLKLAEPGQTRVRTFGVLDELLGPSLLQAGTTDALAQAAHESYVATQLEAGDSIETNSSLVSWDELPESLKDSNRHFADSVGAKLAELGLAAVPLASADNGEATAARIESLIEEMAREEHDRWAADLKRDGWQQTDGEKDPQRKLHPLLVPWSELSEADRNKDRRPIRSLPRFLETVGLRIAAVNDGTDDSSGSSAGGSNEL
jgi:TrkA-N domain/RyR domain